MSAFTTYHCKQRKVVKIINLFMSDKNIAASQYSGRRLICHGLICQSAFCAKITQSLFCQSTLPKWVNEWASEHIRPLFVIKVITVLQVQTECRIGQLKKDIVSGRSVSPPPVCWTNYISIYQFYFYRFGKSLKFILFNLFCCDILQCLSLLCILFDSVRPIM